MFSLGLLLTKYVGESSKEEANRLEFGGFLKFNGGKEIERLRLPRKESCRTKRKRNVDTCGIRTHAPEGTGLAGPRVNHSAKVPWLLVEKWLLMLIIQYTPAYPRK
jgi:hypothetical protein